MLRISHESEQTEDSHVSEIFLYFINNLYLNGCTIESRQTADRNIDCVFFCIVNLYLWLY
jgi:hypothetical protein